MHFAQVFSGFFMPVAVGTAAVFALIALVGLRTHHRSPVVISRKLHR